MADAGERSAEERERARLEREQARLERERRRTEPRQPLDGGAPVADEEDELLGYEEPLAAEDDYEDEDEHEVPLGIRRVANRERRRTPPARRPQPRRAPTEMRPRHSWIGRIVSLLAIAIAGAIIWFLVELFQPFHGSGHGSVVVTIPAHSGARQIGNLLEKDGVVSSGFFFELRAKLAGDSSKLLPGTYTLKLDMSYGDALKVLTTPPPAAKVTNVTLIPGLTLKQIDALLHSQHVPGSYLATLRHQRLLNPQQFGAPRGDTSLEGFLFPDTYQLRVPISMTALVDYQLKTFRQLFDKVNLSYARSRHLTPYDVLIIASIIEKEAATQHDFPLVASVIYNRLHDHIPLGMDSTTRYEFNDYTKPLTQSQLAANSPYNTRKNAGLPPTPIDNPGLAAIQAAANPAHTNYLYFVVKPCGNGASVFTASYAQFLNYVNQYQTARAKRGGRSPTHC